MLKLNIKLTLVLLTLCFSSKMLMGQGAVLSESESKRKLLLISNSTLPGESFLNYPKPVMKEFLGEKPVKALFIPYANTTTSYDRLEERINIPFNAIGHSVVSIHHFADPVKAVEEAEAIIVCGGNTWKLVRTLRDKGLIEAISKKVKSGTPYIGWSAGSNIACPTLRTTNDMPIIDPHGFDVLNLVPFQINPHYQDIQPKDFGGESREFRIKEFITENHGIYVVGLREGTMLWVEGNDVRLIGNRPARIFIYGEEPKEVENKDNLQFLLNTNNTK